MKKTCLPASVSKAMDRVSQRPSPEPPETAGPPGWVRLDVVHQAEHPRRPVRSPQQSRNCERISLAPRERRRVSAIKYIAPGTRTISNRWFSHYRQYRCPPREGKPPSHWRFRVENRAQKTVNQGMGNTVRSGLMRLDFGVTHLLQVRGTDPGRDQQRTQEEHEVPNAHQL